MGRVAAPLVGSALVAVASLAGLPATLVGQSTAIERVRPVVAAVCKADDAHFSRESVTKIRDRLRSILVSSDTSSDEALAILLGLDLGDAFQYDILNQVAERGPRILGFLRQYMNHDVQLDGGRCLDRMRLDEETRDADYQLAIALIERGRRWGAPDLRLPGGKATVADYLKPIISLVCQRATAGSEWRVQRKLDELVNQLVHRSGANADEALVTLLPVYLGESTDTEILGSVVSRGARMVPLLERYRSAPPGLPAECPAATARSFDRVSLAIARIEGKRDTIPIRKD